MKHTDAKTLSKAAVFAALVFIGTMISIPAGPIGNLNFGDGFILMATVFVGYPWAIASAAIGAALADVASGYLIYAPATLVIKGLMVVIVIFLGKSLNKIPMKSVLRFVISGAVAELFMAFGYYLYECILLKSLLSPLASVPFNLLQGLFALIIATFACMGLERWFHRK